MAALLKVSLMLLVVAVFAATSADLPPNPDQWTPPGLPQGLNLPSFPQWQECDYGTQAGSTCQNCNTRLICTKVGAFLKPCTTLRPYCNNGICLATPSSACAPPTESPATEPPTESPEPPTEPEAEPDLSNQV